MGRGPERHHRRGGLHQGQSRDRRARQLRQHGHGHRIPPLILGHQLPHHHQHVHRGHPGKLFSGEFVGTFTY